MAFNKAKALQEAEKSVSQGKTSLAIKQYLDIVEKEPSDLTLLNTIGDLYIREKNVSEGLKHFHKLADAYVQEGFTVKAIAIYRKISKIDPHTVDPLIKLAELYQVQGLGREARDQYLQAVEFYKKKKQNDKAADVLRKVVQLEPENTVARTRLATFLEQIGRKEEAAQVHTEAAELALRRNDVKSAEEALKKAQSLNPKSPATQLLRARLALGRQDPGEVEKIIASAQELKESPAAKQLLLQAYLAARKVEEAKNLVLEVYRGGGGDFAPVASFSALCLEKGDVEAALKPLAELADGLIEKKNSAALIEALRRVWSKAGDHLPTLELLYQVCEKSADEFTLPEVLEALGHTYTQAGDFPKAEQAYQKLSDREPENQHYKSLLKQVQQKQGKEVVQARAEELARDEVALTFESEAVAGAPGEDAEQASMVKDALDNSDLFARYNLPEKAVAELEKVLAVYPDQVEIHGRILEICRKSLPERAVQAQAALERISSQRGEVTTAGREQVRAVEPAMPATLEPTVASQAASAASVGGVLPTAPPTSPHPSISEFDLTSEFGGGLAGTTEPPAPPEAAAPLDFVAPAPAEPVSAIPKVAEPAPGLPPAATPAAKPAPAPMEVDLSGEWEASATAQVETATPVAAPQMEPPSPPAPPQGEPPLPVAAAQTETALPGAAASETPVFNFEESSVEVGFYLENGFEDEAGKIVVDLEHRFPGNAQVAELRRRVEARKGAAATPAQEPIEVISRAPAPVEAAPIPSPPTSEAPETWELPSGYATRAEPAVPPAPEPTSPPSRVRAEQTPQVLETPPVPPQPLPPVVEAPALASQPAQAASAPPAPVQEAPAAMGGSDLLGDLAGDLASSLDGLAAGAAPHVAPPPAPASPQSGGSVSPLSSLLEEMGGTAGEAAAQQDDPETHYNLGVAFREMGLLDEAIGEFQKVAKGAGKGKFPPNFLQACSLLAVCFMDKKMPAVAAKWYLRALEMPDLDEESVLALQYDLGTAYEMAGDPRTALERFTEVYSQNIDFRDVAEKIRVLQQKAT